MTSSLSWSQSSNVFDVIRARHDVPQASMQIRNRDLVYLDSAATSMKPIQVMNRIRDFYSSENANVHRGAHELAQRGTSAYEGARKSVAEFIGAASASEIVFTRGTTESLNLVARALGGHELRPGDEIVLSQLEHHSNIVPWQMIAQERGAQIRFASVDASDGIDLDSLASLLGPRTRLVSLSWVSNVTGARLNVAQVRRLLDQRAPEAVFVLDAAQAVTAFPLQVSQSGADFVAFSGHKVHGPFGIGVLWGRMSRLENLAPYQGGGSMIHEVRLEASTWADVPQKFEAGTPNIEGALGLEAALRWFVSINPTGATAHAKALAQLTRQKLREIPGVVLYGGSHESSIVSFNLEGAHASDLGSLLDQQGIAIRTGHHCCQPLMAHWNVPSTARASFSFLNLESDVHRMIEAVRKSKQMLLD